jgi:hypothetical protein
LNRIDKGVDAGELGDSVSGSRKEFVVQVKGAAEVTKIEKTTKWSRDYCLSCINLMFSNVAKHDF